MSLTVLNKKFLSVINSLGIDLDVFPDKSFDGLFERRHNDLNYFLEWFVENITAENTLTESEIEVYQYLKACNLCLSDEELKFALMKCSPSYEELELIDEIYIDNGLVEEIEEINKEYEKLLYMKLDLDRKYGELKKKPNHLKEECNKTKKKLEEVKYELERLNSYFNSLIEEVNNFKLKSINDTLDLRKFQNSCEEAEKLVERFSMNDFQYNHTIQFDNVTSNETMKLKKDLATSKYCSIVSKSLLEEVKYKILRAEEFLNKVKDESDIHFTFEELFSIWFDINDMNVHDDLMKEVDCMQLKELMENVSWECELIWHNFLCQSYNSKLCENNAEVSKHLKFLKHIKSDIAINLLLKQVLQKTKEQEEEFVHLINELHSSLNKNQNAMKLAIDNIVCRNNKTQDYFRALNEKHALLQFARKIIPGNPQENKFNFNNICDAVKLLIENQYFFPSELFNKLEKEISSKMSNILCGPSNRIQLTPVEVQWEFSNCDQILSEHSHSIQRLLTEYVNTKEAISSVNRRQSLLWIDFLINPESLVAEFEDLQKKSLEFSLKCADISKI